MGEITDFVTLYIEDSDMLEDKASKISRDLEDNIKDIKGNIIARWGGTCGRWELT